MVSSQESPRLPDFIIVGTMKSGTTSLGFHLGNHRQVCIPKHEVHFFDNPEHYEKGPEWYSKKLRADWQPGQRIVGEKTPTYSYRADIPARIRALVPNVKLVWIFRNPVDRTYSNYLHALCQGAEYVAFDEAIAREPERIAKDVYRGYVERSRYHLQVQRYLELFPKSQMHFCLFEEFLADSRGVLNPLFDFLEVERDAFELKQEWRNKTVLPRWPKMLRFARWSLGSGTPFKVVRRLNEMGRPAGYPRLTPEQRAKLAARFTEDNQKLAELTGLDLSVWE